MYLTHYGRRTLLLATFLVSAFTALVYFWLSSWQPPGGLFVLFITFGGVVVAIVSDNKPLSRNEKIGWLIFTGIVAFLEICVLSRTDTESKTARENENKAFAQLLSNARDVISNMTGGDSFAYVEVMADDRLIASRLRVVGRYTLKQVQLKVIDTAKYSKMLQYG